MKKETIVFSFVCDVCNKEYDDERIMLRCEKEHDLAKIGDKYLIPKQENYRSEIGTAINLDRINKKVLLEFLDGERLWKRVLDVVWNKIEGHSHDK